MASSSKYDRQLRIWGEQGQNLLENCKVCILKCGPTGSETAKNLVLGGLGLLTMVDSSLIEESDLGNNFFVEESNLGQPKSKFVCQHLQELNDSVLIRFVSDSPEYLIESNSNFFSDFDLIIATQMHENHVFKLEKICRQLNKKLIIARSYGLMGMVRISYSEHIIIESKPENFNFDLRLDNPWKELEEYVNEFDVDIKDSIIHKHIPYSIILIKVIKEWKEKHMKLPSNTKERNEFKELIKSHQIEYDEENYKEALANAYRVWSPPIIEKDISFILHDSNANVDMNSSPFWIVISALNDFVNNEGKGFLPLDGSIPDMHSITDYFIQLQTIYQKKADDDFAIIEDKVSKILKNLNNFKNFTFSNNFNLGREKEGIVSKQFAKSICKNARYLRVIRYSLFEEEFIKNSQEIQRLLSSEDSNNISLYILLKAADVFFSSNNYYPGYFDESNEEDVARLKEIIISLLSEIGINSFFLAEDFISEFCRFGQTEIHCIASFVGGIASQEAIKLITSQFVPLTGTLIYNGMSSTCSVFDF